LHTKYLLPCDCGEDVPVEPRQAGETIACRCGRSLQVPTMLEMAALEPAESSADSEPSAATWGLGEGLLLAGIVVCLCTLALAVFIVLKRPRFVTPEVIRQKTEALTPMDSIRLWRSFLRQGLRRRTPQQQHAREDIVRRYHLLLGATTTLGLAGVALLSAGQFVRRKRGRPVEDY